MIQQRPGNSVSLYIAKFILFLTLIALCSIINGCTIDLSEPETNGLTMVEGRVTDKTSGNPVPFATVMIIGNKSGNGTGLLRAEIKRVKCDEKGNFNTSFNSEKDYYYIVEATAKDYAGTDHAPYLENGKINKNIEVKIKALAFVRVKIINTSPKDTLIELGIQGMYPNIRFYHFYGDTTILGSTIKYPTNTFGVWLIRSTGEEHKIHEVELKSLDTTDFVVYY